MKILWITDPHLNFIPVEMWTGSIYSWLKNYNAKTTRIFITGDIGEAKNLKHYLNILDTLNIPTFFILGNHDFYGGSIKTTQKEISQMKFKNLYYLTAMKPFNLFKQTYIIGHDGWYDGQAGNYFNSNVQMWDFESIQELKFLDKNTRLTIFTTLADNALLKIKTDIKYAIKKKTNKIIILTHVPPFPQASTYNGKQSNENWLPYFCCKSLGELLLQFANKYPAIEFIVYCGHSHGEAIYCSKANLQIYTGKAQYGSINIKELTLND